MKKMPSEMEVGAYLRFVNFGTPPHYLDLQQLIVNRRVLFLVTELPTLAKILQSHPTAFHRFLETEFGKIFHHYETENVDNDEEWRQVKLATRRPLGARLSTLVSLSQSRGDFPSQPLRIYYADFLGFLGLKIVIFLLLNTRFVNHHRASIPPDLFISTAGALVVITV